MVTVRPRFGITCSDCQIIGYFDDNGRSVGVAVCHSEGMEDRLVLYVHNRGPEPAFQGPAAMCKNAAWLAEHDIIGLDVEERTTRSTWRPSALVYRDWLLATNQPVPQQLSDALSNE